MLILYKNQLAKADAENADLRVEAAKLSVKAKCYAKELGHTREQLKQLTNAVSKSSDDCHTERSGVYETPVSHASSYSRRSGSEHKSTGRSSIGRSRYRANVRGLEHASSRNKHQGLC